jgi:hypothetical protein
MENNESLMPPSNTSSTKGIDYGIIAKQSNTATVINIRETFTAADEEKNESSC